VDGKLTIWNGSAAYLEGGCWRTRTRTTYLDVDNSGTLYVEEGTYCFGRSRDRRHADGDDRGGKRRDALVDRSSRMP